MCTNNVLTYDVKKWQVSCCFNKSLYYVNVREFEMSAWWFYVYNNVTRVKDVKLVIQLLLGTDRQMSQLCTQWYHQNSTHHILFECECIEQERRTLWNDVEESCPCTLVTELKKMNSFEKCTFSLNAFNVRYIPEWENLYTSFLTFIVYMCRLYIKRYSLYGLNM